MHATKTSSIFQQRRYCPHSDPREREGGENEGKHAYSGSTMRGDGEINTGSRPASGGPPLSGAKRQRGRGGGGRGVPGPDAF